MFVRNDCKVRRPGVARAPLRSRRAEAAPARRGVPLPLRGVWSRISARGAGFASGSDLDLPLGEGSPAGVATGAGH